MCSTVQPRILCSNVLGLSRNLSDLTAASSQYDLMLCSETLVSNRRHISELLVSGFVGRVLLCRDEEPGLVGWLHMSEMDMGRERKFDCGCCEMPVFRVCGARQN